MKMEISAFIIKITGRGGLKENSISLGKYKGTESYNIKQILNDEALYKTDINGDRKDWRYINFKCFNEC